MVRRIFLGRRRSLGRSLACSLGLALVSLGLGMVWLLGPWTVRATAQSAGGGLPPNLVAIVFKADDMGMAHAINVGTIAAYQQGVVSSVDVMVPTPWFLEAAQMVAQEPGLDVGIHLVLSSEWGGLKWRPLTPLASLVDGDGYFPPLIWPQPESPGESLLEKRPDLKEIEAELLAQIAVGRLRVPQASFLSMHMGFGYATPELKALVDRLAQEAGLPLQENQTQAQWLREVYLPTDSGFVKARKLAQRLRSIPPGRYIHLDHAAVDSPEMRAIGPKNGQSSDRKINRSPNPTVALDRSSNLAAWTSREVRQVLKDRAIQRLQIQDLFGD